MLDLSERDTQVVWDMVDHQTANEQYFLSKSQEIQVFNALKKDLTSFSSSLHQNICSLLAEVRTAASEGEELRLNCLGSRLDRLLSMLMRLTGEK